MTASSVFAAVIFAALLHATWNAIVKSAGDKFLTTIMVTAAAALVGVVLLPFLTAPAPASWRYAACSRAAANRLLPARRADL